ncbi:MAG: DNA-directed RNA polymerase subunit beta' [Ruminococcaceae bacterium]|nr:DNA-directed RNA polymerase subunit beta' [Oscillospiraceae bacterium]
MAHNTFDSIKIGLASPDQIRAWSRGEVTKPETINYRTLKPERDGLFCERIFGPTKDWECNCGKLNKNRHKGQICDKCGVESTRSKVRRERMGHIELAAPVSHIWYFKAIPSRIGLILDVTPKALEKVIYFSSYIVTDKGFTSLEDKQLLSESEYNDMVERYGADAFKAAMGAEAILELLEKIDLDQLSKELTEELETATGQKRVKLYKRLEVCESFRLSGNRPEWMILTTIPVIPPDIRPMVQLDGGRFATSDLNDLYRRVINRNNRLKKLLELSAPDIIVRNEKRMLQEAVDALIDNGRRGRPVTGGTSNRPLKSLSDMLKGKQGRFRQNLLGKRVDYSGRSVIVVGPSLKMYQCGLPKEMALELFKPFVMRELVDKGHATNIKSAKKKVEKAGSEVWDALEKVIKGHPVLLNRAPTLHRLGIQAFEPVLVEGRALKLHPLVCTAYNADFDGDQMAVHVPLSKEAQDEARNIMLASGNLLKLSDGSPVAVPTQDMVLGSYYLTMINEGDKGEGMIFRDEDEALMAYTNGDVTLHAKVKVRRTAEINGEKVSRIIETTVGRLIFNNPIPQDLGYVDRTNPDNWLKLEVDFLVGKKQLGQIVKKCIEKHGTKDTSVVLDAIKDQGFKYSTKGAVTVAVCDAVIPPKKKELLEDAEKKIANIRKKYERGMLSDEERYKYVISQWNETTDLVSKALQENMHARNPIWMMADSGARGSMNQIKQLAGMRGLIASTSGKTIEIPIKSNYREGLNILEYFISARGARKGLADTALRTADSGYLTRRLVDVSHDVIIREYDCGAKHGITVKEIWEGNSCIEPLKDRLLGRYTVSDLFHPVTGEMIVSKDEMMDSAAVERIIEAFGEKGEDGKISARNIEVEIRSVLNCKAKIGTCAKCYGASLANGKSVPMGEVVGTIAAQSIGEPGTQLTMRTFHTGGIASAEDITQGLPRVEELFEARRPKKIAIMSEIAGKVRIDNTRKGTYAVVEGFDENGAPCEKSYLIPFDQRLSKAAAEGAEIEKGAYLTEGAAAPADILAIKGRKYVQDYIIEEVQKTYRQQGVDINDKHIEVIVSKMMNKVKVDEAGSTDLIGGSTIDYKEYREKLDAIKERIANGEKDLELPQATDVILGITKAALATDSFLSAASFQETTKVLTDAAIKGKVDPLLGLKENVIIGKLIPAGASVMERDMEDAAEEMDAALDPQAAEFAEMI